MKKKSPKKEQSWREAWAQRLDVATSLNGLAESIKNGDLRINREPSRWWTNRADERSE